MRLKVDIILVAGGDIPIRAAKNATKTIPIVMMGGASDPVVAGLVESLAHPGGNVTGITLLSRELGGKRLELLKEAVPKVSRVAALYDPALPSNVHEVKERLPVAARALGLTIRPWEIRPADGLERVFAALSKERLDGLYVISSPLMNANQKRIAGFALKSRLPSVHVTREYVDAGGLMSYGADLADIYRRVAYLRGQNPQGRQAWRSPCRAADEIRVRDQSEDGEADRVTISQSCWRARTESSDDSKHQTTNSTTLKSGVHYRLYIRRRWGCGSAQQSGKIPRVGFLDSTTAAGSAVRREAFWQDMRKLGWIEGKNIAIEYRYGEGKIDRYLSLRMSSSVSKLI